MISLDCAFDAIIGAYREVVRREQNPTEANAALKAALATPLDRSKVLLVLELLPYSMSLPLIPELVECTESAKHASRARALLGRIPFAKARGSIATQVTRRLDSDTADDWVYRRMAELLEYLGYYEELSDLVHRADGSGDSDIREVGDDYRSPCAPTSGSSTRSPR